MKYCSECSNPIECNAYKDKDTGMWSNVWECPLHGKVNPCNHKNDTDRDLDIRIRRYVEREMQKEMEEAALELEKHLNEQTDMPWWVMPDDNSLPTGSCPVIDNMNIGEQNEK